MNWDNYKTLLENSVGIKEQTVLHGGILASYNTIDPLPRGYRVTDRDPWCAIYVSAMWHSYMNGWFPYECSCSKMIELAKATNKFWHPAATNGHEGWLIFYDWERDDSPDHVGYIVDVDMRSNRIRTIEGNYSNQVKERYIPFADKRIYGFVELQYEDSEIDRAKEWATKNRIILGDGTADSWTKPITREQLAVILARYHQAT